MSESYVTHDEFDDKMDEYDNKIRKHIDYSILGVKADFAEYVNTIVRTNREDINFVTKKLDESNKITNSKIDDLSKDMNEFKNSMIIALVAFILAVIIGKIFI